MKLATAEEMRRIDAAAIEKYALPGIVLMENAGRQVTEAVREMLLEDPAAHVLIVCGKGNNGGDGLVVARHLANQGVHVQVALLADARELTGDAATNLRMAQNLGVRITENADESAVRMMTERADLIVDAVLGTGITGEVHGVSSGAIDAINRSRARVIAVDIPSGVKADTGTVAGRAVRADMTVTFGLPKLGLVQYPGRELCGELRVADISLPHPLLVSDALKAELVDADLAEVLLPERFPAMHKGDAGRALVVAGSVGMTGAAALCARAATRAGAGLVTLACPASLNDILEVKCTEAMTVPMPETPQRSLDASAQREVLERASRSDAVALGPGLSQNPGTAEFVRSTVKAIPVPLVLDADGLNCLGGDLRLLLDRQAGTVLTPHPGELARLLGTTPESIEEDRVAAARRAARTARSVVVLKGAATIIAEPEGYVWVNTTGNCGMASGGMGDVLTGVLLAFLAGGAEPVAAAVAAVYYHGLAADLAAETGARGLLASDVVERLREVFPD
jgi:hydroxyethylthiazole kinase-like uncharacterized protein yjeF